MSEMEVTEGQFLSQDFGVGGPPAAAEAPTPSVDSGKTPDILAAEIRTIKAQTGRMVLNASIEVGRRLTEAKAKLPHGSWGEYLKNEVDYSPSQAQNLMRVFREYGSDQQSLFGGEAKSQTFGRLTFSQALSLLVIPDEEERERFVVENDVEHMSVRELNEALKARDEAQEKAAAAEDESRRLHQENERLQEKLAGQAQVYEAKLTSAGVEADQARAAARAAQEARERADINAKRLQNALSEANASAQTAEEEHARLVRELEELRSRPAEADTEAVEAARQAAIAEMTEKVDKAKEAMKMAEETRKTTEAKCKAAEESLEAAQRELADLKAREPQVRELTPEKLQAMTADAVEKARAGELEKVKELEKKLAAADGDVSAFRIHYEAWQDHYNKLSDYLIKIASREPERAGKLRMAVKAVIERMAAG